ncbi:MAG: RimK/LysX family protein [Gammaproteobacteria bacterium]
MPLAALAWLAGSSVSAAAAMPSIGWVENAVIYPGAIRLRARIDTGARISSLRYANLRVYPKDGRRWAEFTVADRNGREWDLQGPVIRMIRVKTHAGSFNRRPVVRLGICVGTRYRDVEVSLARRADFNYPLLIGRSYLAGTFLVDPGRTFTAKPRCPSPAGK